MITKIMYPVKERKLSIELVKFIAVITVANHWMAPLYGKWEILATGGAIGDVLFFFASGYTLFLGRMGRFDNWYKRRIRRISPSVIAFTLILSFFSIRQLTLYQVALGGDWWFIHCIFIYYFILYFVRKYAEDKSICSFTIVVVVIIIWYLFEDSSSLFMYGETYFKWIHYFLFMILGAYLGNNTIRLKSNLHTDSIMLLMFLLLFYGIQYLATRYEIVAHLQIFSLIPLVGLVASIYKLCCSSFIENILRTKIGKGMRFISGLCLEIYLVQSTIIRFMDGILTSYFPINLLLAFILIVLLAYVTRCLARTILQIFDKDELNWAAVFRCID